MGTDHGGANWTPADGSSISGIHFNIGVFTIATGTTVFVGAGLDLEVSAVDIHIDGTLNADGRGHAGGAGNWRAAGSPGVGPGGGGGGGKTPMLGFGGGGSGYGGAGGHGRPKGPINAFGGAAYGSATGFVTEMGSGGAAGGGNNFSTGRSGGAGGGSCHLEASGSVTVSGAIRANGANGGLAGHLRTGRGGGGSGGCILLKGNHVDVSGSLSASGGNGGTGGNWHTHAGGGGGGRIKIFYATKSITGTLTAGGGSAIPTAVGGAVGTIEQILMALPPPTVTTHPATDIRRISAIAHGEITDVGAEMVTERGFEWGITPGLYPNSVTET